jgi:hypothetical protein
VAFLAACSSKELLIEVDTADSDVKVVELMIVDSDCTADPANCAGIGPPGATTKPSGTVYYLDGDERLAAPPVNGSARFALEAGTTGLLPRVIALGFASNDEPAGMTFVRDVDVRQHLGEWWKIPLEPRDFAGQGSNPIDIGANDKVTIWRPPRTPGAPGTTDHHASCAMVTHADQSKEFAGPPGDPDCDTFTGDQECDPSWYQSHVTTAPMTPCLDNSTGPCMVGIHASCIDGNKMGGCAPQDLCVPSAACPMCMPDLTPMCADTLATIATVPRIECTVPLRSADHQECTQTATIDASQQFPDGCSMPGLVNAAAPLLMFTTTINFTVASAGTASLMVQLQNNCSLDIDIQAAFTGTPPVQPIRVGTFAMRGGSSRRVAMPVTVKFTSGTDCQNGEHTTCNFAGDLNDSMWQCTK